MISRLEHSEVVALIEEALKLGKETPWIEWKEKSLDSDRLGRYVSGLANTAALEGLPYGILMFGVRDDGVPVGTDFSPSRPFVGNADADIWLSKSLENSRGFQFHTVWIEGKPLVILIVDAASLQPTRYKGGTWVRRGANLRELKADSSLERLLWSVLLSQAADEELTATNLTAADVAELLDAELLPPHMRISGTPSAEEFEGNRLLSRQPSGRYSIPAATALVFARSLDDFSRLARKKLRFLVYEQDDRSRVANDFTDSRGYAKSFDSVFERVTTLVPREERVVGVHHRLVERFSALAIREALGNALIHQDLRLQGAGPIVEYFPNRIEICNPGWPLMEFDRILDYPPRSRNETLATIMHHLGLCEERGSGWDKLAIESARLQLPAPRLERLGEQFRVTLLPHQPFTQMSRDTKLWSLYLHACLRYVENERTANAHVRDRFGIPSRNAATATRLINDAVSEGLIKPMDPAAARNRMEYIPYWAHNSQL